MVYFVSRNIGRYYTGSSISTLEIRQNRASVYLFTCLCRHLHLKVSNFFDWTDRDTILSLGQGRVIIIQLILRKPKKNKKDTIPFHILTTS